MTELDILDYVRRFLVGFVTILGEMSPFLLLGFFFAGLLYAFMPRQKIEKYFSGNSVKSSILASLFGVPLPLCSCGVIPTGTALYKNGASKGGTVSFLISTPQTGVDSILATFSLLGLPFAIIRPLAALVTGITGGIITSKLTPNESQSTSFQTEEHVETSFIQKVKSVFRYGFVDFIQDISKWLVIGLVLAAVISSLIPDDFFELLNMPPILQMLMILVVSIPLYICATGTIPLAAILILKGISPGAAFVLLMAGPATNAATITMIGKVLGKKSLLTYLGTIISGALIFGLIIDYVLPTAWFTTIASEHLAHVHGAGSSWLQIASGIVLVGLIINGYIQRRLASKRSAHEINEIKQTNKTNSMETQIIKVEGMTCNHCKTNVESNLEKMDFITSAKVNLNDKSVIITGDHVELDQVKAKIDALGYKML